ncbi:MAG: hypothetical protein ABIF01_01455 [Candidatus Micrarchaeota archaeon]
MLYRGVTAKVPSQEVRPSRFFQKTPQQDVTTLIKGLNSHKSETGVRCALLLAELAREKTTLPAEKDSILAKLYGFIFKRSIDRPAELFDRAITDIGPGLTASLFLGKFGGEETVKLSSSNGHKKEALRALLTHLGPELFEILERQFGPKRAFSLAEFAFGKEEALYGFARAFGEQTNKRLLEPLGSEVWSMLQDSIATEEAMVSKFMRIGLERSLDSYELRRYPTVSISNLINMHGLKKTARASAELKGERRTFELLASINRPPLLLGVLSEAFGDERNAFRFVSSFDQNRAFSVARDALGEKKALLMLASCIKPKERALEIASEVLGRKRAESLVPEVLGEDFRGRSTRNIDEMLFAYFGIHETILSAKPVQAVL